jgi:hypothetical protein
MVHHDHTRGGLVRQLHRHGQEITPIRKEGLALAREEEMFIIGIQIRRQAHDPQRFPDGDGEVLHIRAVIIDHQMPLGRGKHAFERRPIGDFLQTDDVRIQGIHDLAELAETVPLVDHLGTEKFDVVVATRTCALHAAVVMHRRAMSAHT